MEHDPELYEKYRPLREYIASLSPEKLNEIRDIFEDVGLGNASFDDMDDVVSMQERRRIRRKARRERRRKKNKPEDELVPNRRKV